MLASMDTCSKRITILNFNLQFLTMRLIGKIGN